MAERPANDDGRWEGDFYTVPRGWPHTRAAWRLLKLAFAGCLHAWADRIEASDHAHGSLTKGLQSNEERLPPKRAR